MTVVLEFAKRVQREIERKGREWWNWGPELVRVMCIWGSRSPLSNGDGPTGLWTTHAFTPEAKSDLRRNPCPSSTSFRPFFVRRNRTRCS